MKPLKLAAHTLTNALGQGTRATLDGLVANRSGLRACDLEEAPLPTWIGRVDGLEAVRLPEPLRDFDCRNNRLALLALEQDGFIEAMAAARARHGAGRIGVFLGTSTSGIAATEEAYRDRDGDRLPDEFRYHHTHSLAALAEFVRAVLGLNGPADVVSTACSSSAKVFAMAHRYIGAGLCDAAVVGGVDSLCLTTLYGFNSLQLVSTEPCRPWDQARNGISIGEAGGFALLERAQPGDGGTWLYGYGESSDAYHMSSPHPEGAGAAAAMRAALQRAGIEAAQLDYVNLHGTATPANDAAEDGALASVTGHAVACSSTKGATGHTLGAAGITEALICALAIEQGLLPGSVGTRERDPALGAPIVLQSRAAPVRFALSNSLGFGGSNCSLVLGAGQ